MAEPRSWLFVPADSERKIAKALDSEADAIIFDLEDSVAPALKSIAKGQNEVKAQFTIAANAPLGKFPIAITGAAKYQGRDYSETPHSSSASPPISIHIKL